MTYEKVIKREDGSKVKIIVSPPESINEKWKCSLLTKEKGEKEFCGLPNVFSHLVTTPEEILSAKLELWEKLKPTP